MEAKERLDTRDICIRRTLKGSLIEAVTATALIAFWAMDLWLYTRPEGLSRGRMAFDLFMTAMSVLLLWMAYHPRMFFWRKNPFSNLRQIDLYADMARWCGLGVSVAMIVMNGSRITRLPWLHSLASWVFMAVGIIYSIYYNRIRKAGELPKEDDYEMD